MRVDVEKMLLNQRIPIEMRLRIVKLETSQHLTSEFVRLREFIYVLMPPPSSTTSADATKAENEPRSSGN